MKAITITLLCLFLANMAFAKKAVTCPDDGSDAHNEMIMAQADILLATGRLDKTSSCFKSVFNERKEMHKDAISNADLAIEMRASSAKALMGEWREGI